MKVLFFLTFFYNTVHTHKYFPAYDTVFTARSSFEFGANDGHFDYPSFYVEPPFREKPRALSVHDYHKNYDSPTGPHIQTRQTYSATQDDPNIIVHPEPKAVREERPRTIIGYNCTFNLCDDVLDYPDDYITSILNSTNAFDSFFKDLLPDIANKFTPENKNMCESNFETRFPKTAVNVNNKTRLVANVDRYKQGVKIEVCVKEDTPCKYSDFVPKGVETNCVQRHTVVPLMALDDDKNPIVDTFLMPSCCVCMFRKV